jgi:hypothetical protein
VILAPTLSQERNVAGFPLSLGNVHVDDWPSIVASSDRRAERPADLWDAAFRELEDPDTRRGQGECRGSN